MLKGKQINETLLSSPGKCKSKMGSLERERGTCRVKDVVLCVNVNTIETVPHNEKVVGRYYSKISIFGLHYWCFLKNAYSYIYIRR